MDKKQNIAIIGGPGLTGTELIKILLGHDNIQLKYITSRTYKGQKIEEVFPGIDCQLEFIQSVGPEELKDVNILFLCLPPHDSMQYLSTVIENYGGIVIDVGSDFRINSPQEYKKWYKAEHTLPHILDKFVYGLCEVNRDAIKEAKYIANPGCYPTSVLLGLYPLLDSKIAEIGNLVIDSKSGVSGAGRKLKEAFQFINLAQNFYAYSAAGHRHTGEMEQEVAKIYGRKLPISFTPHLLPISRGIFSSIYVQAPGLDENQLKSLYKNYYSSEQFVNYVETIPQIKDVAGTNNCLISLSYDERNGILKIFSTIDNLIKGAAGQAVQNMNIALDWDEKLGLSLQGINT